MKSTALPLFVLLLVFPGLAAADNAASNTSTDGPLLNLDLADIPVRDAVAKLFVGRTEGYFIAPGVTGKMAELKLKGITFEQGLKAIADAAGFTYRIEDGIYVLEPAKASRVNVQRTAPDMTATVAPVTMAEAVPQPVQEANWPARQPAQAPTSTQVIINNQPPPVYYGQPADPYFAQSYAAGSVQFMPSYGWGMPYYMGQGTALVGWAPPPPPPADWVSPDVLRFLRHQYILPSRPYIVPGYYW